MTDTQKTPAKNHVNNLHKRFVKWVLLPPFVALIILSLIGLFSLNTLLKNQAITDLQRSADASAAVLGREIHLRKQVLKRTATELLVIQNQFTDLQSQLLADKTACSAHITQQNDYRNSPGGACNQFAGDLANDGATEQNLNESYTSKSQQQIDDQAQRTNERLGAFKQIFPETLALVIVDTDNTVKSSALSGVLKGSSDPFLPYTKQALTREVSGESITLEGYRLGLFAYPINGGAVLAAYDLYNENFLKIIWDSAPIDRSKALAMIIDANNAVVYPNTASAAVIKQNGQTIRDEPVTELQLDDVKHTIVSDTDEQSQWGVVIASPTASVLAQSRDAQLLSVIIICLFIIGFIWVGSLFIQRTLANIVRLMSGALIFSSGRLDYEIKLDNADSEFTRLGETMNKMAQRIAAAEEAIDQKNKEFISVATHEIRAPLTSIIGYLDMLQEQLDKKLTSKTNALLQQSIDSSVRLKNLVNDMLDVARLESGRSEFHFEPVAIDKLIADSVQAMQVVAKKSNVQLEYEGTSPRNVTADEPKLRIIITNFLSNAIKYNRDGGSVTVYHEESGDKLVTAIKDTGLGIPEDQKAHMFEKFFRVEHDDRKSVIGTGLGMYVTKQYIEQMNGRLWFESEHGKGTTFYFSLPVSNPLKSTKLRTISSKAKKAVAKVKRKKSKKS